MAKVDIDERTKTALAAAHKLLLATVQDGSEATRRIDGLAEYLIKRAPDLDVKFKAEAIQEACRAAREREENLRRVAGVLRHVAVLSGVDLGPHPGDDDPDGGSGIKGLTKDQVARLLGRI